MPLYPIANDFPRVILKLQRVTSHYTNDDLRLIRREARLSPDRVNCPRCSLRAGRAVLLKVVVTGPMAKFTCPQCGEQTTVALERSSDS